MDDLEQAVLVSTAADTDPALREKATEYLNLVRQRDDAWKIASYKLFSSTQIQVKLFCLLVVQDLFSAGRSTPST